MHTQVSRIYMTMGISISKRKVKLKSPTFEDPWFLEHDKAYACVCAGFFNKHSWSLQANSVKEFAQEFRIGGN